MGLVTNREGGGTEASATPFQRRFRREDGRQFASNSAASRRRCGVVTSIVVSTSRERATGTRSPHSIPQHGSSKPLRSLPELPRPSPAISTLGLPAWIPTRAAGRCMSIQMRQRGLPAVAFRLALTSRSIVAGSRSSLASTPRNCRIPRNRSARVRDQIVVKTDNRLALPQHASPVVDGPHIVASQQRTWESSHRPQLLERRRVDFAAQPMANIRPRSRHWIAQQEDCFQVGIQAPESVSMTCGGSNI